MLCRPYKGGTLRRHYKDTDMDINYPKIIAFVFRQEGGYTDHPSDPGGATNWGITIKDAQMYWKPGATKADVKAMPKSVAEDIYYKKYWLKVRGPDIASGLDACTMDSGVNSGTARSDKWLAKAIGSTLKPYPELARLSHTVDLPKAVKAYCATRLSFLHGLKTWGVFGKGWGRRVAELQAMALVMALSASGKPAGEIKKELGKEVAQTKTKQSTDVKTGSAGTAATGGATWTFWEWDLAHVGIAAAAIAVVAFFVWRIVQNNHQIKAYEAEIAALEPAVV